MPKLPEGKTSILEVADKTNYSHGQITFPKVPKYHIVFKHHLRLALLLVAVCCVLALAFFAGKPLLERFKKEETTTPPVSDVEKFQVPNETNLKYLNLEYHVSLTVDNVDLENKLVYGTNLYGDGKKYVVRIVDKTQIVKSPGMNEPVSFASESARTIDQITKGHRVSVVATEDPKVETYINAASIVIE